MVNSCSTVWLQMARRLLHHQIGIHFVQGYIHFFPKLGKSTQGYQIGFGSAYLAYLLQMPGNVLPERNEPTIVTQRSEYFHNPVGGINLLCTLKTGYDTGYTFYVFSNARFDTE